MRLSFLCNSTAAWLFFAAPVAAFYPYIPPYMKGDNPDQRRAEPYEARARIPSHEGIITLPIRRTPVKRENKYSILTAETPSQTNSVQIDQDGHDYTYFSPMTFGSGTEEYHMLMDTAASNTWVMSSTCTSTVCEEHNTLGPDESDTLTLGTKSFSITYGTGSVNGTTASDIVHFAGKSVNLTFGLASGVSNDFSNYPLDGILGFGRGAPDPNSVDALSIIDVLASNSLIPAKLVGVHLARAADPPNDGQMNLGAPNPELYDGDLAYIDVLDNTSGFWEIPIDDAGAGGNMAGLTGQTAILDTGTTFMLVPPTAAATLHKQIPGSAQSGSTFTIPCSTTQPVQLVFGGIPYNISTKDYIGSDAGNGACHSNIIGLQTFGDDQWLVGDVFLKNVYVVFDYEQDRVGLGVKSEDSGAVQQGSTTSSLPAASTAVPSNPAISGTGSPSTNPSTSGSTAQPQASSSTQAESASPTPNSATWTTNPPSISFLGLIAAFGSIIAFV